MDFADTLLSRINGETETKRNNSALICFSSLETGKTLSRMATYITRSKSEKSSVTFLYLISGTGEGEMLPGEKMDEYQHRIISGFIPADEKDKITLRLFVRPVEESRASITKIVEDQKVNLILAGAGSSEFDPESIKTYSRLRSDPTNSDAFIFEQFEEREAGVLKNIHSLFSRNTLSAGLFIDKGATEFRKVFIPLLHKTDLHLFTCIHRIAQQENMRIMLWDAIGLIPSDPKIQKLYQFIAKKAEGRISLWNTNRKITSDFIREQALTVISTEGWDKLIRTPLPWTECLPSTLIIKEKTNSM
ncbi:MAG: hypothetical protein LBH72_07750 [Proteiniphilum sp.]|jgi:hypothetical protein|nr:hypothetical protein [Proteiniphilum sp.]